MSSKTYTKTKEGDHLMSDLELIHEVFGTITENNKSKIVHILLERTDLNQ